MLCYFNAYRVLYNSKFQSIHLKQGSSVAKYAKSQIWLFCMCGLSLLIPLLIKPLYFSHYTSTYSGQQQQTLWPSVIFYCIQQAKGEHVNIKLEECFFNPLPSASEKRLRVRNVISTKCLSVELRGK